MKRSVQVEVAGQQLTIRSDEGPDYIRELAGYVDAHVNALGGGRRVTSPHRVALLVAMQITDELFREKDLQRRFRARVGRKLEALRAALDDHEQRLDAICQPRPPPPRARGSKTGPQARADDQQQLLPNTLD